MNKELLNDIRKIIYRYWSFDEELCKKKVKEIKKYLPINIKHILETKFKKKVSQKDIVFVDMGGSNVIIRICKRLFRIQYHEPLEEYKKEEEYIFNVLTSHDFGINAPISYTFETGKLWYYEIRECKPFQGATLKDYSKLFHKVFKLHKYNLFWFDVHNGNIMTNNKGELTIVDFDVGSVEKQMKERILKFKNVKLKDITPYLNKYINDFAEYRDLRFKIFMYIKLEITNENWMRYCFGEFMFKNKYNIVDCYTTSLFEAQVKTKGDIGF